jgi:hypothetical protein
MYVDLYKHKHIVKISNTYGISVSIQEIIEIAIIPVLKKSVYTIVSCLLNEFGYFETAWLFVTGSFLTIREYNSIYDMIITEMERSLND